MKPGTKTHFLLLIPLALMLIIFLFSASPATESTATSQPIVDFTGLPEAFIRKSAHFALYALLGASWYFYLYRTSRFTTAFTILASLLFVILYAIIDEFHQTFIPGRTGLLTDVLIDTAGGLTGITIFAIIHYIASSPQHKKSRRKITQKIWRDNDKLIKQIKGKK